MKSKCNFTLAHYKQILEDAKKTYSFCTFSEYEKNKNKDFLIILRHDVEIGVKNLLSMARIEAKLGIPSTYFFRVNAEYNLFFYDNYKMLKELISLGHEIGLHLTEGAGDVFSEDNTQMILRQKAVLEAVAGKRVLGMSTHEPSRTGHLVKDENLAEYGFSYQAYSDRFTKDMKYVSESAGKWYEKCVCNFISEPKKYPRLCILTHPMWWYHKSPVENY